MIREFLFQYALHAFAVVAFAYAVVKIALIYKVGLRHNKAGVFMYSIFLYRKQTIKNTFSDRLRKYYKASNEVNVWFYMVLFLLLGLYAFMILVF
jgi:hypothetical protein